MKKSIILDIDGTLISAGIGKKIGSDFTIMIYKDSFSIFKRPYLNEFLDFCFKKFEYVIIWSAAEKKYIDLIIQNIFLKDKPHIVWTRDKCENIIDINYEYTFIKPLRKFIRCFKKYNFNYSNLFIIDDMPETARLNKFNFIQIKSFDGNENDDKLKILINYLSKIKNYEDIRLICYNFNN